MREVEQSIILPLPSSVAISIIATAFAHTPSPDQVNQTSIIVLSLCTCVVKQGPISGFVLGQLSSKGKSSESLSRLVPPDPVGFQRVSEGFARTHIKL